ncbi:MAG: peptidoglycan DD-metalloendopeptidase family protein [Actinomycetales bacterium]
MRLPRLARLAAVITAVSVAAAVVPPAVADPKSDAQTKKKQVESDIGELQESLAGTSAELTEAYGRLADARSQLPAAQAALDEARAVEAEAERKDAEMAGRLAAAEAAQAQAQADLDASADQLADTRDELARMAAATYRRGAASTELSVVMNAESPQDFADRFVMADTVLRTRSGAINDLTEKQVLQSNAQARLTAVTAQVAELREQARQALAAAEAARAEAAARKDAVDNLIAAEAAATAVIESRKAEEESHLGSLKAEQDKLSAQLAEIARQERAAAAARAAASGSSGSSGSSGASGGGGSYSAGGGTLGRPVNTRITSSFGYRIHPIYKYRRLHTGTDFGGPCGIPIHAAADGRVVSAGWAGGYGNRIVVAHGLIGGSSIATAYNHMSRYAVRGGTVKKGQVIGYVGTTGSSTGCHLHFEVLKNGSYVNPMGYL